MDDRTLFIADEIACAYVDSFLTLPLGDWSRLGNVFYGRFPAQQRHEDAFFLTH